MKKSSNSITKKEIENFIERFLTYQSQYFPRLKQLCPTILFYQFNAGYCYYFAHMLQFTFDNIGEVMLILPIGHFVWKYKNNIYDITGCINDEYIDRDNCYIIPESYIDKNFIKENFMHMSKQADKFASGENKKLIKKKEMELNKQWCKDNNIKIDNYIFNLYKCKKLKYKEPRSKKNKEG